jgi:hypothetical protein
MWLHGCSPVFSLGPLGLLLICLTLSGETVTHAATGDVHISKAALDRFFSVLGEMQRIAESTLPTDANDDPRFRADDLHQFALQVRQFDTSSIAEADNSAKKVGFRNAMEWARLADRIVATQVLRACLAAKDSGKNPPSALLRLLKPFALAEAEVASAMTDQRVQEHFPLGTCPTE